MNKIINSIKNTAGKKRYLLSFFFGTLVTLALPPVYIIPAAIAGFTAHFWQLGSCQNKKQSFWLGWWFGWGHFTSGLYWISFALLIDVKRFGWMIPFAIFGIPAIVAFYTALVSLITFITPQKGYQKVVIFAIAWTFIEILRGHLFTGFPWNLTGYIWTASDSMLQLASITGIWGLSFFTVLAFTMPAAINLKKSNKTLIPTIITFSILILIWAGGFYKLNNVPKSLSNVKIRVVQANIQQDHKWDSQKQSNIIQKYLQITSSEGFDDINHVIWPETALPFVIDQSLESLSIIKEAVPKGGTLITGSLNAQVSQSGFIKEIFNSIHAIGENGQILGVYNKHHLVPFGEYIPSILRLILPIEKITADQTDFSRGKGNVTVKIPNFPPFSPLICYEAIFPEETVSKNPSPSLIINVTNDAWYGNSSGPYQHFNMVKVRAVEQGVPLIRAANTGISGVIDAYGRIIAKTKLGQTSVLDVNIPTKSQEITLYNQFGNYIILAILLVFTGFVIFFRN